MFTLATQIVDPLCVQFPHNAASFSSTKAVSTDLGGLAKTMKLTNAETKELCLKGRCPEEHRRTTFLQQLRCEGILLGWVSAALQPDLHDEFARTDDRRNPEVTCWFYLWTTVEDFMLDAWLTWMHQTSGRFHHTSLHFHGIMLRRAPVAQEDRSAFGEGVESAILGDTQYNVHVVLEEHEHFVASLLRQGAPLAADCSQHLSTEFTREGICIPAAVARMNGNHETL